MLPVVLKLETEAVITIHELRTGTRITVASRCDVTRRPKFRHGYPLVNATILQELKNTNLKNTSVGYNDRPIIPGAL